MTVSPSIVPYLGLYPDPQTANLSNGDAGTYNTTGPIQIRENFSQTRIDNSFPPKDSLSLTYHVGEAGETLPDILVNIVSLNHDERELGAVTERHLFSNNLINVLRLGYNRNVSLGFVPLTAPNPVAGNTNLGYQPGFTPPLITIPGFASLSGLGSPRPSEVYFNSYQLNEDFALTKGKHNIKVGFAAERILSDIYAPLPHGNVAFLSFANFLKDIPYAAQFPGADSTVESANSIIGGYVQDDWRFSRQLSLNLGLRYEISTLPYDRKNALGLINTVSAPVGSGPCPTVIAPTSVPGCTVPVAHFFSHDPTLHNFEPRVGFAYDVFDNGKTSLRGAYGIYDLLPIQYLFAPYAAVSAPFSQDRVLIGTLPAGSFPNGIAAAELANPNDRISHYIDPHPKRDYSLNYNLNIEQQFSKQVSATIGCVGSHSIHLPFQSQELNHVANSQVQFIGGRTIFPIAGAVAQDPNNGTIFGTLWDNSSHYNGLNTQLKVSGYQGLTFQATYTWQQCIDYGPVQNPVTYSQTLSALYETDFQERKGSCDFNLTQVFSANGIYEMPTFGARGFLKSALGGLQLGTIVSATTGSRFTIIDNGDVVQQKGLTYQSLPDLTQGCNPINSNFKNERPPVHQLRLLHLPENCADLGSASILPRVSGFDGRRAERTAGERKLCLHQFPGH